MHPPRIPFDFTCQWTGAGRCHFIDQDTPEFWFGLLMALAFAWQLWRAHQPGGEFPSRWPFPTIDRDAPVLFWAVTVVHAIIITLGLYLGVCGLIGATPADF